VYSRFLDGIDKATMNYIEGTWDRVRRYYTKFIYFPIEFKSVDDGVRSINEEWRESIDKEFVKELEYNNIEYLTVTGSPKQRVEQIKKYI